MNSATTHMLGAIRKRRENLERLEQLILEEFGESSNGLAAPIPTAKRSYRRKPSKRASPPRAVNLISRKAQMHDWLKKNGPATRSEIIAGSGLPEGTISGYLSAEKNLFENRDGVWHAR